MYVAEIIFNIYSNFLKKEVLKLIQGGPGETGLFSFGNWDFPIALGSVKTLIKISGNFKKYPLA